MCAGRMVGLGMSVIGGLLMHTLRSPLILPGDDRSRSGQGGGGYDGAWECVTFATLLAHGSPFSQKLTSNVWHLARARDHLARLPLDCRCTTARGSKVADLILAVKRLAAGGPCSSAFLGSLVQWLASLQCVSQPPIWDQCLGHASSFYGAASIMMVITYRADDAC